MSMIEIMKKEYKEHKEQFRFAQERIDKGNNDPIWEEVKEQSIRYMITVEDLLTKANISLEVLTDD